jgi:hypothetical protein
MSKIKKLVKPPKPVSQVAVVAAPVVKDPTNLRNVKAVEYKITLSDGSYAWLLHPPILQAAHREAEGKVTATVMHVRKDTYAKPPES